MNRFVLGVDGGNTKTIALVATLDGTISAAARGGSGDIYSGSTPEVALGVIGEACSAALRTAAHQEPPEPVAAAAFSLAGADWPEDFALLRSELPRVVPAARPPLVVNDALGALRAGTEDAVGVSIVCGTGHAIGARGRTGETWHSSFWGRAAGAIDLGRAAFHAIQDAELGLGGATSLTPRALDLFGAVDVTQLLHELTRRGGRQLPELGRLAAPLLDEAEAGDAVACAIVARFGQRLGDYARVGAERAGLAGGRFPLVLAGGVFRHPSRLLDAAIAERVPLGDPVRSRLEPAVGALLLAFDELGVRPDPARLLGSLPPVDLFGTA